MAGATSAILGVLNSIADRGRDLLSQHGEAIGTALAREVVESYRALPEFERLAFFQALAANHPADSNAVLEAAESYREEPSSEALLHLWKTAGPTVRALFGRINMAQDGTAALVDMRRDLLELLPENPGLKPLG